MANPLFNQYGQNNQGNILQQFMQFKKNFRGDPQAMIQELLNSGKISQEQYNQAVQRAQALRGMFGV